MDNCPVVSVVIITYNSSIYVKDALESVKKQSYSKIELIVSDDCSSDNTVEICKKWLYDNKNRFERYHIIESDVNTGIPANCNRGVRACHSEWIKLFAGDDLLCSNCISDNMQYISEYPNALLLFSNFISFSTENGIIKLGKSLPEPSFLKAFNSCKTAHEQLKIYLSYGINITPSLFYKKSVVEEAGWFNERYKFFEDTPFLVEVLKAGIKLSYINVDTVYYRKDTCSVTRDISNRTFYKEDFINCALLFKKEKIYPLYRWYNIAFWLDEYSFIFQYYITVKILKNKRTNWTQFIYNMFKLLNPYNVIRKIL